MMTERLEQSHGALEDRIRERTAKVEDKVKRISGYNRSLATVSRLSTKVFIPTSPLMKCWTV